jgi:hypothetical protein
LHPQIHSLNTVLFMISNLDGASLNIIEKSKIENFPLMIKDTKEKHRNEVSILPGFINNQLITFLLRRSIINAG